MKSGIRKMENQNSDNWEIYKVISDQTEHVYYGYRHMTKGMKDQYLINAKLRTRSWEDKKIYSATFEICEKNVKSTNEAKAMVRTLMDNDPKTLMRGKPRESGERYLNQSCPCGSHYTLYEQRIHEQSARHKLYLNPPKVTQRVETINCPCGGNYRNDIQGTQRHEKRDQHIDFMNPPKPFKKVVNTKICIHNLQTYRCDDCLQHQYCKHTILIWLCDYCQHCKHFTPQWECNICSELDVNTLSQGREMLAHRCITCFKFTNPENFSTNDKECDDCINKTQITEQEQQQEQEEQKQEQKQEQQQQATTRNTKQQQTTTSNNKVAAREPSLAR